MKRLLLVAFVCCSFFLAPSFASADFTIDNLDVIGIDVDKKNARREAQDLLDDQIEFIDENLPDGHEVIGVNTSHEWNGAIYTITFSVIISEPDG